MLRLFIFFIVVSSAASADEWDDIRFKNLEPGKRYSISIGSGFFVNQNNIVTNKHVVEHCLNIAVRGAVKPTLVKLIIVDDKLDLAILESPLSPARVPYLRNNYSEIQIGDILFSVGYPLERGQSGNYIILEARVIKTRKDRDTGFTHIEFTDNVNHGNSGGPLLDKNSNLVGVVTAKLVYKYSDPSIPPDDVAMAIGAEGLISFLKKFNIPYASSSSYDIFTNYHVDRLTRDYVVNVHCVQNTVYTRYQ